MPLLRPHASRPSASQVRLASTAGAVLAGAILFSTGAFASWSGVALVGLLMAAVEEDLRHRRIPNRLTFFGILAALAHAGWTAGAGGLLAALAGAAAGFAVLLVPFTMRWLGAGDVKAVMAVGAFYGVSQLPGVLYTATVIAGGFAAITLLAEGGALDMLRRWSGSAVLAAATRRPFYFAPAAGSTAASGLPFAVALALGIAAHAQRTGV